MGTPVPAFDTRDWTGVSAALGKPWVTPVGARVVILNHPRDKHSNFRPFGPERHLALTGEDLDGWELPANAMELVNSGAHQSDMMRPVRDWFGMLNRGRLLTPVGSSDSHDVSRYIVGQGRTYVRCKDDRPGAIDALEAVKNILEGRVTVSCGLLAELTVDGKYGPGDLVSTKENLTVAVRVLGPSWVKADRIELFANGVKVRESAITDKGTGGVKWSGKWELPRLKHDSHLVAVASGPGVSELFWPIAKSYQPTSPVVRTRVISVTGVVWVDADGDGRRTSAFEIAQGIVKAVRGDWKKVISALGDCDEAVAAQAAGLLRARGVAVNGEEVHAAATKAGAQVSRGFNAYAEQWRESQIARQDTVRPR